VSDLSFIEKSKLEKLLKMAGGYVLHFSNRTLRGVVAESTGRDIYDSKYDYSSGSKANRLRAFWKEEPNHVVGKLTADLLEYVTEANPQAPKSTLYKECAVIAERLKQGAPGPGD
jgi:hypothetical protein